MELEPRTLLGQRFEVVRKVGSGGMANVYLLVDNRVNKQWAGKQIKLTGDPAKDALLRNSFETELAVMKTLDHAALPRITDIVDDNGRLYVIMDFVEGSTLSNLVSRTGARSQEEVVDWGIQLCDVLDYLHTRNPAIYHRDMKPSNVMLTPDGQIKLIDFGIARFDSEEADSGQNDDAAFEGESFVSQDGFAENEARSKKSSSMLGTRGYAAPEQYDKHGVIDERTDVYSLGVTLYYLLTGQSPVTVESQSFPIRQVKPELSAGLESVILKATSANKEDRYQSCAEMLYALEHYDNADKEHQDALKRKLWIFRALMISAVACLVLGLVGLGARYFIQSSDYANYLELAAGETNQERQIELFQQAISIDPSDTRAYEGLLKVYQEDGVFTTEEQSQALELLLQNLDAVKKSPQDFARLSYDLGCLYWYSYELNSQSNNLAGQRAAVTWFEYASAQEDFEDVEKAKVYQSIAAFNTSITPLIEQGSDVGQFGPYRESLNNLLDIAQTDQNEVVRLNSAFMVASALETYARKFRADGVQEAELYTLYEKAKDLARSTRTTASITDELKQSTLDLLDENETSISNAYKD